MEPSGKTVRDEVTKRDSTIFSQSAAERQRKLIFQTLEKNCQIIFIHNPKSKTPQHSGFCEIIKPHFVKT